MKKILVTGAGGFIGGHLVKRLLSLGYEVTAVDKKPIDKWFQIFENCKNFQLDLKLIENCYNVVKGHDTVFNLACNMGGIGFIESFKTECMLSVLINSHLLLACRDNKVQNYFFSSSACVYNTELQKNPNISSLKEDDAYPAMPEDGYGWEKLFSERMCTHFHEEYNLNIRIARFHNIFGPLGTFDGGREKSPAALCRKIAHAKINEINKIEVWGTGLQTRSYLYIDDCIDAVLLLMKSNYSKPINIGSDVKISINEMINLISKISNYHVDIINDTTKPIGVMGRSSNNDLIKKELNWSPSITLEEGLLKTYDWISNMIINKESLLNKYNTFTENAL